MQPEIRHFHQSGASQSFDVAGQFHDRRFNVEQPPTPMFSWIDDSSVPGTSELPSSCNLMRFPSPNPPNTASACGKFVRQELGRTPAHAQTQTPPTVFTNSRTTDERSSWGSIQAMLPERFSSRRRKSQCSTMCMPEDGIARRSTSTVAAAPSLDQGRTFEFRPSALAAETMKRYRMVERRREKARFREQERVRRTNEALEMVRRAIDSVPSFHRNRHLVSNRNRMSTIEMAILCIQHLEAELTLKRLESCVPVET